MTSVTEPLARSMVRLDRALALEELRRREASKQARQVVTHRMHRLEISREHVADLRFRLMRGL